MKKILHSLVLITALTTNCATSKEYFDKSLDTITTIFETQCDKRAIKLLDILRSDDPLTIKLLDNLIQLSECEHFNIHHPELRSEPIKNLLQGVKYYNEFDLEYLEKAIPHLDKVIEEYPDTIWAEWALYGKVKIYSQEDKNPQKQIEYLKELIQKNKDNRISGAGHYLLGTIYNNCSEDDCSELEKLAKQEFKMVIKDYSTSPFYTDSCKKAKIITVSPHRKN
ncbi:MAG: hypothetical protein ABIA78_02990 [archaeon]